MKKLLLVTLQDINIGNRLQNYALQTVLKKMGYDVYTPYYDLIRYNTFKKKVKRLPKVCLGMLGIEKYKSDKIIFLRERKFKKFNRDYIDNMFKVSYSSVFCKAWDEYDFAVSGSDQVWHKWSDKEYELDYFYLKFIAKEKRISYAPSFGFEKFPQKDIEKHKEGLNEITGLSCREKNGQQIINDLVGRKAEVLIDPTMLLNADDWRKISRKPSYISEKPFILLYFLGEKTTEYKEAIDYASKKYNLKIIDINDNDLVKYICTAPDEFLWLVEHAKMVYTDSFHACVFSILFKTQFIVFRRCQLNMEKMFGRIETLLTDFSLLNHIYNNDIKQIDDLEKIEVHTETLTAARNKAISYLKNNFNSGE